MKPENIQKLGEWIEALKSGKYEHVKGNLCINNKYCCLGVWAKLRNPDLDIAIAELSCLLSSTNSLNEQICGDFFDQLEQYIPINSDLNVKQYLALINDTSDSFQRVIDILEPVYKELTNEQ